MEGDPKLAPITIDPNISPNKAVLALFSNGLPHAAGVIVELARGKESSVTRLHFDAAKYVIEYVMGGGLAKVKPQSESDDALAELRQSLDLLDEVEEPD